MSERDALLRAVCENPDEDTPRLVFADWLQENGGESDQARAEFIRVQIEQSNLQPQSVSWWKCRSRAQKLFAQYKWGWQYEIVANREFGWGEFVRGFADSVAVDHFWYFKDFAKPIFERTPLTKLLVGRPLNLLELCAVPRVLRLGVVTISVGTTTRDDAKRFLDAAGEVGPKLLVIESPIFSPEVEQLLRDHFGARLSLPGEGENPIVSPSLPRAGLRREPAAHLVLGDRPR